MGEDKALVEKRIRWSGFVQICGVYTGSFPNGPLVKNLPHETQEMQVRSLGWEDLLEEELATHSNILAWKTPWTEEPGWIQSKGLQRVDMTEQKNDMYDTGIYCWWVELDVPCLLK